MASLAQIEANRRNAQKSTGPSSAEGKAASSQNALKSGIDAKSQVLPDENPEGLETLAAEYYGRFRPSTPEARHLVDTLVSNEWLLRRFRRIEVQILKHEMASAYSIDKKNPVGDAYTRSERSFDRLQRRINAAERNYHRALKELLSLAQSADSVEAPAPIGFVPERTPNVALAPAPAPSTAVSAASTEIPESAGVSGQYNKEQYEPRTGGPARQGLHRDGVAGPE